MNRLYLALGLLVIIAAGWWRYDYIVKDRDAEKSRADNAESQLLTRDKELKAERKNASDAEARALIRFNEKEELQREYDEKVKCINAGDCGVRVRWQRAICATASVHSAEPSAIGSDELQEQEQRDFGRWVASLEKSIETDTEIIEGFKQELEIKSRPDYCKAK